MTISEAVLLGFVQGFTEFLPISSSGHLVLFRSLFGIDIQFALAFDAILHLATVLAIIIYFYDDLWFLSQTALRKLGRLPVNRKEEILMYALVVGTLPAATVGFFAEPYMTTYFNSPLLVAIFLFFASLFFMYGEWRYYTEPRHGSLTVNTGFRIGLFQMMALLPGFSRSGATIVGGMLLGLNRYEATKFAFLLAIPITLGVGLKKFLDWLVSDEVILWVPVLVSAVVSFFVALLCIHYFLKFIRRYTLWPFVWYTLIISIFILFVYLFA